MLVKRAAVACFGVAARPAVGLHSRAFLVAAAVSATVVLTTRSVFTTRAVFTAKSVFTVAVFAVA